MMRLRSRPASTLVEIMLYFVLLAIVLTAAMSFAVGIGDLYGRASNQYEVGYAANFIHDQMLASTLQANGLDAATTTTGVDEGSIGLSMVAAAVSPTRYYVSGGDLYKKEGTAAAQAVNPESAQIDYFRITTLSPTKAPAQVLVDIKISTPGVTRDSMAAESTYHWAFNLRVE